MNAIDIIRQWCAANGYSFVYGNPSHVNVWMGETDFSASTDGVCVYAYLLTASEYDGNRDSYNVGIYFTTLTDFDFDNTTIDTTTESLKERAKTLLNDLSNGNVVGWSGARFEYGYDDFAENVCWCCLRVTLTALAAECVEYETPEIFTSVPQAAYEYMALNEDESYLHDDIAVGKTSGNIVLCVVLVSDVNLTIQPTCRMTLNGTELTIASYQQAVIDAGYYISMMPSLSPYEGKYIYIFDSSPIAYSAGTYVGTASVGDMWTATATWEEE